MTNEEFYKQIVDGSQMVSLLLVFLSILFGIKYPLIADLLRRDVPDPARAAEREAFRESLWSAIGRHVLPIGLPSLLLALVLAPSSIHICSTGGLNFPTLRIVPLLFLLLEISVSGALMWCVFATVVLLWKMADARGSG